MTDTTQQSSSGVADAASDAWDLDERGCRALLRESGPGHVSLPSAGANPVASRIWPVQYRCRPGAIVFRLPAGAYDGTLLTDLAFHAYGWEGDQLWSVVATGEGRDVTDPIEILARAEARLRPGPAMEELGVLIEMRPRCWSGHRFPLQA